MLSLQTILCPTDFSPSSLEALDKAAVLATQSKADLCVLHVTSAPVMSGLAAMRGGGPR